MPNQNLIEGITDILWKRGFIKLKYIKESKTIKPHNLTREELTTLASTIASKLVADEMVLYQIMLQVKNRNLTSMDEFLEEKKIAHELAIRLSEYIRIGV